MPKRPPVKKTKLTCPKGFEGEPDGREVTCTALGSLRWTSALPLLRDLDDDSVDLLVADPPYAINKAEWDHFESIEAYVEWCDEWLAETERVLKDGGSAFVCGFSEILAEIKVRSSKRFSGGCRWLIWYYKNKANLGGDWGRSHESILHLRKGKVRLNIDPLRVPYNGHTKRYPARTQSVSSQYSTPGKKRDSWQPHPLGAKPRDVIEIPVLCNGVDERTGHPTQKPQELIRRFIEGCTQPGDLVVDPFVGSGTTAAVAESLGRRWLCGENDPRYLQWTIGRVGQPSQRLDKSTGLDAPA